MQSGLIITEAGRGDVAEQRSPVEQSEQNRSKFCNRNDGGVRDLDKGGAVFRSDPTRKQNVGKI